MNTDRKLNNYVPVGFDAANSISWQSPSNIALVKYWGKKNGQIPANASLSFTLSECLSISQLFVKEGNAEMSVFYSGEPKPSFEAKAKNLLSQMTQTFPVLAGKSFALNTFNTFPHSSGIASSASGMSALALCLCDFLLEQGEIDAVNFYQTSSYWARIGSGSACRSVFGGYNAWGHNATLPGSSDYYALNIPDVHPDLQQLCDYILLVDEGPKLLDSTAGHSLMLEHSYATARYRRANANFGKSLEILINGDIWALGALMEAEALDLHAMMMTSAHPFWLIKPGTLAILERIRAFRKQNELPVFFTLDAGANVHCIFPQSIETEVKNFIDIQLKKWCANESYICDRIGTGPVKILND